MAEAVGTEAGTLCRQDSLAEVGLQRLAIVLLSLKIINSETSMQIEEFELRVQLQRAYAHFKLNCGLGKEVKEALH